MKNQNYYQLMIVIGVFLFYGRILFGDMPFTGDYLIYQLPEKTLIRECLQQGSMPFINPYILSGTPMMENIATGSFYPLNILLIFGSPVFGFNLFIFIHILLAGWAMYILLAKGVNLHKYASCIGGLSYALSGPLWGMLDKGFIVSAWLIPLFFWGVILFHSSVIQKRVFGYISSVVTLTLFFYSGNLLEAYFAIIVAGIGSVWFAFCASSANFTELGILKKGVDLSGAARSSNIEHPISKYLMNGNVINYHTIKLLFSYVFLVFTSVLLALPQLLPTYKASLISYRSSGVGLESAQHWSFPVMRIIEYFVPFAFGSRINGGLCYGQFYTNNAHAAGGSPWFDAVFTGFPILCAAIFLFFSLSVNFAKSFKEKKIRLYHLFRNKFFILFIGLIFFLLLALGRQTPLYSLCYYILPGFKVFRHPEKFIEWVNILLIIFGAYGLDRLFRSANSTDSTSFRRVVFYLGVTIFVIFAILSSLFIMMPAKYSEFFHKMGSRWNGENIYLWQGGALLMSVAVLLCIHVLTRKYNTNPHKTAAVFIIITIFYSFVWSLMIQWTVPGKISVRVTDGPCWVVLRDWFAPGWHCYDSTGKEIPIIDVDGGTMAIYVNKQNGDFYFKYIPEGLKSGILCAICGLVIVFSTLVMYFYHTKQ